MTTNTPYGRFPNYITPYSRIQPFTYRDSRTFIEVLEHLRAWVSKDLVNFINGTFERMTDEIDEAILDIVKQIQYLESVIADAAEVNENTEKLKNEVIQLISQVETLKTQIEATANEAREDAQAASDALDEIQTTLANFKPTWASITGKPTTFPPAAHTHAADDITGTLDAARLPASSTTARGAVELATNAEANTGSDTARAVTPAALAYTLDNSLPLRMPELLKGNAVIDHRAPNTHAVFLGASNSTPGTFPEKLASRFGWQIHNYSVGGTGFTHGATPFAQQAQNAVNDNSYNKNLVRYVFICGAGNDVRAGLDPTAGANTTFQRLRQGFPNTRIILLPVLWGVAELNMATQALTNMGPVLNALRTVARDWSVEFVEHVHLWHWEAADHMISGEVHFAEKGNNRIADMIEKYLTGQSTDNPQDFTEAAENAGVDVVAYNAYRPVGASRQGNIVTVEGSWLNTTARSASDNLFRLPQGLQPNWETKIPGSILNSATRGLATIYRSGWVRFSESMPLNSRCHISGSFPVF